MNSYIKVINPFLATYSCSREDFFRMLKVEEYTQEDASKIIDFIRKIQPAAEPDKQILSRSVLIKDNEDIVGMVSYESHDDMGIIRYFLYNASITRTDIVVGMFFELYKKARENGVKRLIARVTNREVGVLFEMLGFVRVTNDGTNLAGITGDDVKIMLINLES